MDRKKEKTASFRSQTQAQCIPALIYNSQTEASLPPSFLLVLLQHTYSTNLHILSLWVVCCRLCCVWGGDVFSAVGGGAVREHLRTTVCQQLLQHLRQSLGAGCFWEKGRERERD